MIMLYGRTLCFCIFSCKYMWPIVIMMSMMIILSIMLPKMIMYARYFCVIGRYQDANGRNVSMEEMDVSTKNGKEGETSKRK